MTIASMTGFATQEVVFGGQTWVWDIRSVNGRGLDIKTKLPDGAEGLDSKIREMVSEVIRRGSIQVSLRRAARDMVLPMPGPEQMERLFAQIAAVQSAALLSGVTLAPVTAAEVLDGRLLPRNGVIEASFSSDLSNALTEGLGLVLEGLVKMRGSEGEVLNRVLTRLINQIEDLIGQALALESRRGQARAEALAAAMRRVLSHGVELDAARLEQELALLAVKADIVEELDRLEAHVAAARSYLKDNRPVGRKLDFLTQEFNREANTLCAKAQFAELTRVGLDLKAVIDQVREQVQNVE